MTSPITGLPAGIRPLMDNLQYRQELHDRIFHSDIYTLAKPERLKHLVLHQFKYISRIYGASRDVSRKENMTRIRKQSIDGFIVVLSMMNVCNSLVMDHLRFTSMKIEGCLDEGIRSVGQLAKIVEDMEHLASNSPTIKIREECLNLLNVFLNLLVISGLSLKLVPAQALDRLIEVEKQNIHFERHEAEILRLTQIMEVPTQG